MKLSPKDQAQLIALFREIRGLMDHADQAAAELVAATYGVKASEVLRLAFFETQPPPRKGPSAALFVVRRSEEAA